MRQLPAVATELTIPTPKKLPVLIGIFRVLAENLLANAVYFVPSGNEIGASVRAVVEALTDSKEALEKEDVQRATIHIQNIEDQFDRLIQTITSSFPAEDAGQPVKLNYRESKKLAGMLFALGISNPFKNSLMASTDDVNVLKEELADIIASQLCVADHKERAVEAKKIISKPNPLLSDREKVMIFSSRALAARRQFIIATNAASNFCGLVL